MSNPSSPPSNTAGQGFPPRTTFSGSGGNAFDQSTNPSTPASGPGSAPLEPFNTTADTGTQTHRPRRPSVNFSDRVEVRGPDGTSTHVPATYPSSNTSSDTDPAQTQAQAGAQGPPANVPPRNPPPPANAAAPEPGQPQPHPQPYPYPQQPAAPLPTPPRPFGGSFGGPPGAPPPVGTVPTMNMNQ